MDQRFCTACGTPLAEGAVFCSECGASVTAQPAAEPAAEELPVTEQPPVYIPPAAPAAPACEKPKKTPGIFLRAVLAAGLVGAAAKLFETGLIRRVSEAVPLSRDLVHPVVGQLIGSFWQIALYAMGAGALLILIFTLIRLVQRRRTAKI